MKKKLIDLAHQRAAAVDRADAALNAGDQGAYSSAMEEVHNLNAEIGRVKDLIAEQERRVLESVPTPGEARDRAEEGAEALRRGGEVTFSAAEVLRGLRNATTLATGTLAEPSGAGTEIRDPAGSRVSSIVDQVYVQDLTGLSSYAEPYVISELDAKGGKVTATAGTARTPSTDPVFGVAEIRPYELTVTSYVDRNISRLSPADYFRKIQGMAMSAMRRKLAGLIVNGDGQATPDMYGMTNGVNKAGSPIFATETVTAVDEHLLDTLFFAYGSDAAMEGGARLLLNKLDLRAIGLIRNANKERVYRVIPDEANPNTGVIEDGGLFVPYTIVPDLPALSLASTAAATACMLYGSPLNYELGLFGPYTIRVDESVKAVERMHTILGDAFVGGNLIRHHGMVAALKGSAAGSGGAG